MRHIYPFNEIDVLGTDFPGYVYYIKRDYFLYNPFEFSILWEKLWQELFDHVCDHVPMQEMVHIGDIWNV